MVFASIDLRFFFLSFLFFFFFFLVFFDSFLIVLVAQVWASRLSRFQGESFRNRHGYTQSEREGGVTEAENGIGFVPFALIVARPYRCT